MPSALPTQVLLSLATFFPLGQMQTPPSRELLQTCSQLREGHRVVAGGRNRGDDCIFAHPFLIHPMILTTSVPLVGPVRTVVLPVAQLALRDTLGSGTLRVRNKKKLKLVKKMSPTMPLSPHSSHPFARTVELVVRAGDGGAVHLVGAVGAVLVAVAPPPDRDAQVVLAAELAAVTGGEIWE